MILHHATPGALRRSARPPLALWGTAGALCGVLLALPPLLSSCSLTHHRPNVLLVTFDTVRADHVGCYGAAPTPTPTLDRLAQQGILFEQALTPVPLTLPSHTTMLTGQEPSRHGVLNNGAYRLPPAAETVTEAFQRAGYRTAAFVSAFVLNHQFGLGKGFEVYDDSLYNERSGPQTAARAIGWLSARDPKPPFFLWVHFFDPHTPWTPPSPYRSLPLSTAYDQEIATADGSLDLILEWLRAHGLLEKTIVTVLGDHGEGLRDHGETEHGIFLYRETTRVPWVVRLPGARHAGTRVTTLAGTIDLAPTLLELAGLAPLRFASGRSLAPVMRGGPAPERNGLLLESLYAKESFGWAPLVGFGTEEWTWISAPQPELYNLSQDPRERTNLADSNKGMAAKLDRWMKERVLVIRETSPPSAAPTVDPAVAERLRSLGYLSGGTSPPAGADETLPDPKSMVGVLDDFAEAKQAMDDNRFRAAIPPFRRVITREPRSLSASLGLGIALCHTYAYPEAEGVLRHALTLSPHNTTAQAALADALLGQWRYAEALESYRQASADANEMNRAEGRMVSCLLALGRTQEAESLIASAIGRDGAAAAQFRDLETRVTAYRQARAAGAQSDSLRLALARAASGVDLVEEVDGLLKQPSRSPRWEPLRLEMRTYHLTESGRPLEALETLHRLQSLRGVTPQSREYEVKLLMDADRPAEALALCDRVLASETVPPQTRAALEYRRAGALARLSRPAEAVAALGAAYRDGYADIHEMSTDPDLYPLRSLGPFRDLVEETAAAAERAP